MRAYLEVCGNQSMFGVPILYKGLVEERGRKSSPTVDDLDLDSLERYTPSYVKIPDFCMKDASSSRSDLAISVLSDHLMAVSIGAENAKTVSLFLIYLPDSAVEALPEQLRGAGD